MDDGYEQPRRPDQPPREPNGGAQARLGTDARAPGRSPREVDRPGNGLLSRYAAGADGVAPDTTPDEDFAPPVRPRRMPPGVGLPAKPAGDGGNGLRGRWQAFTVQARRLGQNLRRTGGADRTPRAGEWKATDFDPHELEEWDRRDSAPFEVPPDPDQPYASGRPSSRFDDAPRYSAAGGGGGGGAPPRDNRRWRDWDDDPEGWEEEDAAWETGTWDTGWATGFQPSVEVGVPRGARGTRRRPQEPYYEDDPLAQSLGTLARLGAIGEPIGRVARVRLLLRRRPAAAGMLAFFLLGFMLACCAPLIPILRLGYDAADAYQRVTSLQKIFAGGASAAINPNNLKDAQAQLDGITHDLYEINGAMNIAAAPLAAVSSSMADYRLLVRMGFDLVSAGDEGLQVARTILTPLEGGALGTDTTSPGLTQADIDQARGLLADASARVDDALIAYHSLDVNALPGQLKPGTKYGNYLAELDIAPNAFAEVNRLLDVVPAMLGIGQPANYLVMAMDRSELRPGGGFIGNVGFLTLQNGKQSTQYPISLHNAYDVDQAYFQSIHGTPNQNCFDLSKDPMPPQYYWWWPYRTGFTDNNCTMDWGVRDSNLSPDFPTNARAALQIINNTPNQLPANAPAQGVVAFTPVVIGKILDATGPLPMPDWNNVVVTSQNLEFEIHEFQLGAAGASKNGTGDRKEFTHELSQRLLARIKTLHGAQLGKIFKIAQDSIKDKDLQLYFVDPRAELLLQQLGLDSSVHSGNGDGFMVVDANDGGNKANTYVAEHQTDYVTLLPDGGALHQLQIAVTYAKNGSVYDAGAPMDYSDVQRTYMPGDATILGYSGFNPSIFGTSDCGNLSTIITDCTSDGGSHTLRDPVTNSDVPGRQMVLGTLLVQCGPSQNPANYKANSDRPACNQNLYKHTQTIYIEWYTPHAFTMDAHGHGTYSELVEKQAGSVDTLTVYVNTSQLHAQQPKLGDYTYSQGDAQTAFAALIQGQKPVFDGALASDTMVSMNF